MKMATSSRKRSPVTGKRKRSTTATQATITGNLKDGVPSLTVESGDFMLKAGRSVRLRGKWGDLKAVLTELFNVSDSECLEIWVSRD